MNRIAAMVMSGFLALFCLPTGFAQEWQPVPVSEYAEKSGPKAVSKHINFLALIGFKKVDLLRLF
jgi:hypothetical protein